MKKYIKPEMKSKLIELENCILAGSISVPISEDPATGPALSNRHRSQIKRPDKQEHLIVID